MAPTSRMVGGSRCVLVVGAAYLVQGLIAAVGILLLFRLALAGVSLETQGGILASGAIPWVLKFAIAMLLDLGPSWPLRVRALALTALQICAAACVWMLAQSFVGTTPASVLAIAVWWFALNLCTAAQDVIVDALALDTLAERRPATATAMGVGVALGTYVLGMWIVGARIDAVGVSTGLQWPVAWIALLALLPACLLWRPGRPSKARELAESRIPSLRELVHLLWIPPLFVGLTFAGNVTSAVTFEFFIGQLGWDFARFFAYVIPVAGLASLVGALACKPLLSKLGPAHAGLIASATLGLVWLSFAAAHPLWSQRGTIMLLAGAEGLLQSALLVALHALALLAAARTPLPTTAFVLAMAAINLPRVLAPLVAPRVLELGWVGLFVACGLLQLLVSAGVWPLASTAPRTDLERRA